MDRRARAEASGCRGLDQSIAIGRGIARGWNRSAAIFLRGMPASRDQKRFGVRVRTVTVHRVEHRR